MRQALYAASAACWLRNAYASASFLVIPCCSASFSAVSAIGNPQYVSVSPAINESSSAPPPSFKPPRAPRITTAPASCSPCRPRAPSSLHRAAAAAPPAQWLQSPTRTAGSPSPRASRFSILPSIPRAARRRAHPRWSASRCQKSRDQILPDPHSNAGSPLSKHAPPARSHSPPKTRRYTAPSASAPPPQSPHPSETYTPPFREISSSHFTVETQKNKSEGTGSIYEKHVI